MLKSRNVSSGNLKIGKFSVILTNWKFLRAVYDKIKSEVTLKKIIFSKDLSRKNREGSKNAPRGK